LQSPNRRKLYTFFLLFAVIGLFISVLDWSTHSQKGLQLTWAKFLKLMPGKLEWERLDLHFLGRTLEVKNLEYTTATGQKIVRLGRLYGKLRWSSLLRARAIFSDLQVQNLSVDVSGLPPSNKKTNISPTLQFLSRRLAIERSNFENMEFILKNAFLTLPQGYLMYHPSLLGKNTLQFGFENSHGQIASQNFLVQKIQYNGTFSVPDIVKEVFLFREAAGTLNLSGISSADWNISDISTQANFNGDVIDFKGVDISLDQARYLLKLKIAPFHQHAEGNFSSVGFVEWEEFPLFKQRVAKIFDKMNLSVDFDLTGFVFKEIEGKISANVKAQGNLINPKVPTASLQCATRIKQGRFDLTHFNIQTERSKIDAKGFVDLNQMQLNTTVTGTDLDLKTLVAFFSDLELLGYVDFNGTIQGNLKSPDFRFKGKAKETGYKFMRFAENEGDFSILNGNLHYGGKPAAGAGYSGGIDLTTYDIFKSSRRTVLKTNFEQMEVAKLLENPDMTGKLSGIYEMQVGGDQVSGKLTANVKDFHFYYFNLGDVEAEGIVAKNVFKLPKVSFQPPKVEKMSIPSEIVFNFTDAGFTFKGPLLPGMSIEGNLAYARKDIVNAKTQCNRCALAPLIAAMGYAPLEGTFDARGNFEMHIGNFQSSNIQVEVSKLNLPMGESVLAEAAPLKMSYHSGAFYMDRVDFNFNDRTAQLRGSFVPEGPLNLSLNGEVDLGLLKNFREYFREGSGPAKVNLKALGTLKDPKLSGWIEFEGGSVSSRTLGNTVEDLKGKITLEGDKIVFDNFQGSILEGDLKISGTLWQDHFKITKSDVKIEAREIAYTDPGNYKLILSGKLSLTGTDPKLRLAGNLDITEGRYIKNFDIRDFILKPSEAPQLESRGSGFENLELDLRIKSPGELMVKNNIAEIYLKSDLRITGTKAKPVYEGALAVLDGKINYFKINFEEAKGFVDFRNPEKGVPYVDIIGKKLFERSTEDIVVNAHVEGFTDNLNLSFVSDPPLEKREILALIFTGSLPQEQGISSGSLASSILASQITNVIEKPVTGFTHLDIFKLEASDPEAKSLTSLVVGKKITDRLSLEFKTDLSIEDTITNVQAEYLILDNLLLKASRSSIGNYRLELTFRFKGY